MKYIQPISIYQNGDTVQAVILDAYAVNVVLGKSATFFFALLDEKLNQVSTGNLVMEGSDYASWEQDDQAWAWISEKLKVSITGDFKLVPSVTDNIIE